MEARSPQAVMRRGGETAIREASILYASVRRTLLAIEEKLSELGIDYAIAGGMLLWPHGYDRTTDDVDRRHSEWMFEILKHATACGQRLFTVG